MNKATKMLQKAGNNENQLSGPEALIYGAGILGGGSLGWLLSAATNSAEKHKKRRLWYALAGAAAGGAGAHAFLQSEAPVPLNGEKVSWAQYYRAGNNDKRYRLKDDPEQVFTETQKANKIAESKPQKGDVKAKYLVDAAGLTAGAFGYAGADCAQKAHATNIITRALRLSGPNDPDAASRISAVNRALDDAVEATTPKSTLGKVKQTFQHIGQNYKDFKQTDWRNPEAKLNKALGIFKDPPYVRDARLKAAENFLSKDNKAPDMFANKATNVKTVLGPVYDVRQSGSRPTVSGKAQALKISTHSFRDNPGGRLGTATKTVGKGFVGLLADIIANKIGAHLVPSSKDFPGYTDADFEPIQD